MNIVGYSLLGDTSESAQQSQFFSNITVNF